MFRHLCCKHFVVLETEFLCTFLFSPHQMTENSLTLAHNFSKFSRQKIKNSWNNRKDFAGLAHNFSKSSRQKTEFTSNNRFFFKSQGCSRNFLQIFFTSLNTNNFKKKYLLIAHSRSLLCSNRTHIFAEFEKNRKKKGGGR